MANIHFVVIQGDDKGIAGWSTAGSRGDSRANRWDTLLDTALKSIMCDGRWQANAKVSIFVGRDSLHLSGEVQDAVMQVVKEQADGRQVRSPATTRNWEETLWRHRYQDRKGLEWKAAPDSEWHGTCQDHLLRNLSTFLQEVAPPGQSSGIILDYQDYDLTYDRVKALGSVRGQRDVSPDHTLFVFLGGAHGFDSNDDRNRCFIQAVKRLVVLQIPRSATVNLCEYKGRPEKFTSVNAASFVKVEHARGVVDQVILGLQEYKGSRFAIGCPSIRRPQPPAAAAPHSTEAPWSKKRAEISESGTQTESGVEPTPAIVAQAPWRTASGRKVDKVDSNSQTEPTQASTVNGWPARQSRSEGPSAHVEAVDGASATSSSSEKATKASAPVRSMSPKSATWITDGEYSPGRDHDPENDEGSSSREITVNESGEGGSAQVPECWEEEEPNEEDEDEENEEDGAAQEEGKEEQEEREEEVEEEESEEAEEEAPADDEEGEGDPESTEQPAEEDLQLDKHSTDSTALELDAQAEQWQVLEKKEDRPPEKSSAAAPAASRSQKEEQPVEPKKDSEKEPPSWAERLRKNLPQSKPAIPKAQAPVPWRKPRTPLPEWMKKAVAQAPARASLSKAPQEQRALQSAHLGLRQGGHLSTEKTESTTGCSLASSETKSNSSLSGSK